MSQLEIILAAEADLPAINAIYNHYVATSTANYALAPMSTEDRQKWLAAREPIHPVIVARLGDEIVGWASIQTFRAIAGYRHTVENSVYVHPDHHRSGVGAALLDDLIRRARALGLHAMVAAIDSDLSASLALHAKHGFKEVGRFPQIGRKFDRWLDAVFMELLL